MPYQSTFSRIAILTFENQPAKNLIGVSHFKVMPKLLDGRYVLTPTSHR